jgi:uncharacterized membrane protein/protein-disulfide isomerase
LTGLSALGLALSAFLAWHFLVGGTVIGCTGGSSCDQVLNSRWSVIGGVVPVSGLAAGAYLAMLVASLSIGPATPAPVRRMAWGTMLVLVGAVGGSAVWFTIVQKWIIGAFCPYCMITHTAGLLLTTLVIWQAPEHFINFSTDVALIKCAPVFPEDGWRRIKDGWLTTMAPSFLRRLSSTPTGLALVGLAMAGILAVCQAGFAPRPVSGDGNSRFDLPILDPRNVPLVGSPEAPYVVKLLFDYKCPHCQQMHFLLDEAIRRYGGKLTFALCPTPLNRQCNPYIPRDVDEYKDSCQLVQVGLAVWVAKSEAFPAFNRWMFTLDSGDRWRPRSLDSAKAKAVELVGQAKFDAAQADPWIDEFMQTSIRIYGGTIQGGNAVPKLVFGSRWVIPEVYDVDDLVSILQDSLAVPKP